MPNMVAREYRRTRRQWFHARNRIRWPILRHAATSTPTKDEYIIALYGSVDSSISVSVSPLTEHHQADSEADNQDNDRYERVECTQGDVLFGHEVVALQARQLLGRHRLYVAFAGAQLGRIYRSEIPAGRRDDEHEHDRQDRVKTVRDGLDKDGVSLDTVQLFDRPQALFDEANLVTNPGCYQRDACNRRGC